MINAHAFSNKNINKIIAPIEMISSTTNPDANEIPTGATNFKYENQS